MCRLLWAPPIVPESGAPPSRPPALSDYLVLDERSSTSSSTPEADLGKTGCAKPDSWCRDGGRAKV